MGGKRAHSVRGSPSRSELEGSGKRCWAARPAAEDAWQEPAGGGCPRPGRGARRRPRCRPLSKRITEHVRPVRRGADHQDSVFDKMTTGEHRTPPSASLSRALHREPRKARATVAPTPGLGPAGRPRACPGFSSLGLAPTLCGSDQRTCLFQASALSPRTDLPRAWTLGRHRRVTHATRPPRSCCERCGCRPRVKPASRAHGRTQGARPRAHFQEAPTFYNKTR